MGSTAIGSSTMIFFQFLGLVTTCTDVSAAMVTNSDKTVAIRDPTLQLNVLKSKYEKAENISQEDFL